MLVKKEGLMPSSKIAKAILWLLVLQFALGMLANMYVELPQDKPWEVFHQFGFVTLHAVNGVLLLVLGAIFMVQALKAHERQRGGVVGFLSMVVAVVCGELFVFSGNDVYSFGMALSFLGAFVTYAQGVFSAKPKKW